jgi:hypothetical protein
LAAVNARNCKRLNEIEGAGRSRRVTHDACVPPQSNTHAFNLESLVPAALPRPVSAADHESGSTLTGLMTHLDAVYAFAHSLTSDTDGASALVERVYRGVTRDLWSTLGGHSLRDRLLARCLAVFNQDSRSRTQPSPTGDVDRANVLALLADLPLDERAAVALVDRLGLPYASAAAVVGAPVDEFRATLHRARRTLIAAAADLRTSSHA